MRRCRLHLITGCNYNFGAANRQMTDEEVEKMIEDQDPQIFSEQVSSFLL